MLSCFYNLGYSVEWRVINAAEYGFQQRRKRVFIFASKLDTQYSNKLDNRFKNIILNNGFFSSIFQVTKKSDLYHEHIEKDLISVSNNFKFDFKNSGIMINGNIYTMETLPSNTNKKNINSTLNII